jgi:hypothetical protein
MSWLKNYTVFFGSIFVTIASIAWGVAEGGFEPWIVAVGGGIGIAINWGTYPLLGRRKRNLKPEEKIALRDKWRPVFESYFLDLARKGQKGSDCIIHDVDRLDNYPDLENEKGISSWFRVGLVGTYHRGILLGLKWTRVEEKDGEWSETNQEHSESSLKVALIGQVPYESIESANFEGDDYYNKPHIYCHFEYFGEPYEKFYYGEQFQLNPRLPCHYRQIAEYESVSRKPIHQRIWLTVRKKPISKFRALFRKK